MSAEESDPVVAAPPTDSGSGRRAPQLGAPTLITEVAGQGTVHSHGESITFDVDIHSTDRGAAGRCIAHGDRGTFIKVRTLSHFDRFLNTVTFAGHAVINGQYLSYHAEIVNRSEPDGPGYDTFIIRAANRSYLGNVVTGHVTVEHHEE